MGKQWQKEKAGMKKNLVVKIKSARRLRWWKKEAWVEMKTYCFGFREPQKALGERKVWLKGGKERSLDTPDLGGYGEEKGVAPLSWM